MSKWLKITLQKLQSYHHFEPFEWLSSSMQLYVINLFSKFWALKELFSIRLKWNCEFLCKKWLESKIFISTLNNITNIYVNFVNGYWISYYCKTIKSCKKSFNKVCIKTTHAWLFKIENLIFQHSTRNKYQFYWQNYLREKYILVFYFCHAAAKLLS